MDNLYTVTIRKGYKPGQVSAHMRGMNACDETAEWKIGNADCRMVTGLTFDEARALVEEAKA